MFKKSHFEKIHFLKIARLLCREIEKGKYASSDVFAHYEVIIEKREVLLLSDHRLMYCEKNDLFGGWQVCLIWGHILSIM